MADGTSMGVSVVGERVNLTRTGVLGRPSAKHRFLAPVRWMLGRKLMTELQWIAINSLVGSSHSGIGWMDARESAADKKPLADGEKTAPPKDLWFDYLADTGDSTRATYRVAVGCLSSFSGRVKRWRSETELEERELPRGEFLLIGGDSAYHVADPATLEERLLEPFRWAEQDLKIPKPDPKAPRHVYAIPGNHDHYNALVGFRALFRAPAQQGMKLADFHARQRASYFALDLPHDWRLLALDVQKGMDPDQQAFFEEKARGVTKLILATPTPTTVLGKWAYDPDAPEGKKAGREGDIVDVLDGIGLGRKQPFLKQHNDPKRTLTLPDGILCRLDLSGDTHHYARYWGPATKRGLERSPKPLSSEHYASIVSGLGGAFLHPPHARARDISPNEQYPDDQRSRAGVYRGLSDPISMVRSGNIFLVGFAIAVLSLAATRAVSSAGGWSDFWNVSAGKSIPSLSPLWIALLGTLAPLAVIAGIRRSYRKRPLPEGPGVVGHLCAGSLAAAPWLASVEKDTSAVLVSAGVVGFFVLQLVALYAVFWVGQHLASTKWRFASNVLGVGVTAACFVGLGRSVFLSTALATNTMPVHLGMLIIAVIGAVAVGVLTSMTKQLRLGIAALAMVTLIVAFPALWSKHRLWPDLPVVVGLVWLLSVLFGSWRFLYERALALAVAGSVLAFIAVAPPVLWPGVPELPEWLHLAIVAVASGLGACVWLGWYFGIALARGQHVNEAGGAASVDRFTQFLRICVRKDGLEVFAIAVTDGEKREGDGDVYPMEFEVIDHVRLVTK
jgi:hypothetical protein